MAKTASGAGKNGKNGGKNRRNGRILSLNRLVNIGVGAFSMTAERMGEMLSEWEKQGETVSKDIEKESNKLSRLGWRERTQLRKNFADRFASLAKLRVIQTKESSEKTAAKSARA